MRNKIFAGIISGILACMIFLYGILSFTGHLVSANEKILSSGTYSVDGILRSATSNQASMGNAAIAKPMQIIADGDKIYLRMECKALTTSLGTAQFTGYLGAFHYFPGWKGGSSGYELPKNEAPVAASVKSYYKNVYDKYNHPQTGTDAKVKGKLYPQYMTIPVKERESEIWVQVYVPVMEEISKGSGLQYARLQLDWDTLKQISTEIPEDMKEEEEDSTDKDSLQNSSTDSSKNTSTSSSKNTSDKLDVNDLKDGIYSVSGQMLKIDKETRSMANEAVGHTIKLAVKKGKYYLTLDFKGLEINSQFGYLSNLKYFISGYSLDQYGAPKGSVKEVSIDSYQKDSEGNRVRDRFGTNYPDKVTFPLIKEALSDGYVPLKVFVPIMESISSGSGTQPVFLKLDWSTLKSVTGESVFKDTDTTRKGLSSGGLGSSSLIAGTGNLKAPLSSETIIGDTQDILKSSDNSQSIIEISESNTVSTEEGETPNAASSVISILVSLVGMFYKGKSRGVF